MDRKSFTPMAPGEGLPSDDDDDDEDDDSEDDDSDPSETPPERDEDSQAEGIERGLSSEVCEVGSGKNGDYIYLRSTGVCTEHGKLSSSNSSGGYYDSGDNQKPARTVQGRRRLWSVRSIFVDAP